MDLGTTYSCVGVHHLHCYLEIIRNDQGNYVTPSWVSFTDNEILIGEAAKNQTAVNPERTIFDVKKIKDAVVTVPVYFNDAQRQATKDACAIAGLNVARIIDKPTAAVIAYGIDRKASHADTHFGGEDFDRRITDYLIWLIKNKHGRDIIISKDDIGKEQIDEIVMIGGSSRIPKVEQMLEDYFKGKKPINHGIHPDETVVFGASFLAGTLSKDGVSEPMEERWRPLPRVVAFHTRCSCRRE
ncbi:Heat shock-related 70 kDa protein 2 (Fragments) [Linum perenne]